MVQITDLEVVDEILGVLAQLTIEDGFTSALQQKQLVKGLKDVNAGLVDGAYYGSARVDNVTHCPHDNGSCSGIKTCMYLSSFSTLLNDVCSTQHWYTTLHCKSARLSLASHPQQLSCRSVTAATRDLACIHNLHKKCILADLLKRSGSGELKVDFTLESRSIEAKQNMAIQFAARQHRSQT